MENFRKLLGHGIKAGMDTNKALWWRIRVQLPTVRKLWHRGGGNHGEVLVLGHLQLLLTDVLHNVDHLLQLRCGPNGGRGGKCFSLIPEPKNNLS